MATPITCFLCGDVMTGRGIDQVLPHPDPPRLYEAHVKDANDYVRLAERVSGLIQRPVDYAYVWGDGLAELDRRKPELRIVNLETSVTSDGVPDPKGINYRMNPANVACLVAARVDCCVLANNHVLDWGEAGLFETLDCLRGAGFATAGAGRNLSEAQSPALFELASGPRVRVYAFATESSGVPAHWAAGPEQPGIAFLRDVSERSLEEVRDVLQTGKRPEDVTLVSLHWGANWGYSIPESQRSFARGLIDRAGVDVVFGHSSHHPKGIEVYRRKLILYGCGDLINDYEGIRGHEVYRAGLGLMYFAGIDPVSHDLDGLELVPLRLRRLCLERASREDATWLSQRLDAEGASLGTRTRLGADGVLELRW